LPVDASNPFVQHAYSAAQMYGVPPDLFIGQLNQETGFNPTLVGSSGEKTIAQFMPGTGQQAASMLGLSWQQLQDDPFAAIDAAANYMRYLYGRFGSWDAALIHYNAGEGAQPGSPGFNQAQGYAAAVNGQRSWAQGIIHSLQGAPPGASQVPVIPVPLPSPTQGFLQGIQNIVQAGTNLWQQIQGAGNTIAGSGGLPGAIGNGIDAFSQAFSKTVKDLTSWAFWATPVMYLAGGIMVLLGLIFIGRDLGVIQEPSVVPVPV
jgi:Transglycosylase SLT domain